MDNSEKALILWIRDNKTSIEDIKCVPESCRFVGKVAQVAWSGDNKRYPAKILMISSDMDALDAAEDDYVKGKDLLCQQNPSKRKRVLAKPPRDIATDQQIAIAGGSKLEVPKNLKEVNSKIARSKRQVNKSIRTAITAQDSMLIDKAKKKLALDDSRTTEPNVFKLSVVPSPTKANSSSENESDKDMFVVDKDKESGDVNLSLGINAILSSCSCKVCKTLSKFRNDTNRAFINTLGELLSSSGQQKGSKQYLQLADQAYPKVEITKGSEIFMSLATKNQIKLDFQDQPKKIAKETLFALFGRDAFKSVCVTARGNRAGSCGIRNSVLAAVLAFVNRNVSNGKKMTSNELVTFINKRAPEWRSERGTLSGRKVAPTSTLTSEANHDDDSSKLIDEHQAKKKTASNVPDVQSEWGELLTDYMKSGNTPVKVTSANLSMTSPFKQSQQSEAIQPVHEERRSLQSHNNNIPNFWNPLPYSWYNPYQIPASPYKSFPMQLTYPNHPPPAFPTASNEGYSYQGRAYPYPPPVTPLRYPAPQVSPPPTSEAFPSPNLQ